MTLLEDLENVARMHDRLADIENERCPHRTIADCLREHARRLRHELERACDLRKLGHSQGRTLALVERINGGPK